MSLSIGGGNIPVDPQISLQHYTTPTQDEVNKKGVGNKVVMPPPSDSAGIMLTMLDPHTKYKYDSQPGRPLILPAGSFRSAGPNTSANAEDAVGLFNQLVSQLPLEMQEMIREARDQDALVLKEVLQDASKMLDVQKKAMAKIETEDAILRSEANTRMPIDVFRNVARIGKEFIESAKGALDVYTANDPSYLPAKEFIDGLEGLLDKAKIPDKDNE